MALDQARLHRALNPATVAVVGDKGPNYMWLSGLSAFTGRKFSVQLDEKEIPGIEAKGIQNFRSLLDVPGEVDLVICAVPRGAAMYVVADAVKKGVGGITMFTSGFAETGDPQAAALQLKLADFCREAGLPLVGPNCMGVYNRRLGVKFGQGQEHGDEGGDVSIVSQSGTHGSGMTIGAQRLGLRVARTISIGNAAVLNECDYLEYLAADPDTSAILMYLEGIRDGRRFAPLLRETVKHKPVIIWRGGRSAAGARAVQSHTASLASDDAVWDALLRQAGVIAADSQDDALDALAALVRTPPSAKRNLALVASAGGQSVAIADQFGRAGFEVPALSQRSYDQFDKFFNAVGQSYRNPFDAAATIGRDTENMAKIFDILADDDAVDGGAVIEIAWRGMDDAFLTLDRQLAVIRSYQQRTGRPVIIVLPGGGGGSDGEEIGVRARTHVAAAGFAVYPTFARAAIALGRVVAFHAERAAGRSVR
ncbi:MAG: hypothetical protein EXR65_05300 [Dehalococcoidia bacterium]|nr:hypothetical protein [Dehalococcoidia bacterium]